MSEEESLFPELKNDLILKATRGENVSRVPVWVMRQAGRYLPEFRNLRVENEFFDVCRTPSLACEVTMMPIRKYDLDAAIIFSDILVIPQALGMQVEMQKGKGPVFPKPLLDATDIKLLNVDVDVKIELKYVLDAITLTRKTLDGKCPLIGFAGAPWTLMAYMIEGGGSKTYSKVKKCLYVDPDSCKNLLNILTRVCIDFLVEQVKAGAQILQVFDSHAGELSADMFNIFCLPYLKDIATSVKKVLGPNQSVPMIIFAKGSHYALKDLGESNYDVIALDWTMNIEDARRLCPHKTLMGNLDPCALYSSKEDIDTRVKKMVQMFGTSKYIANLGHGIYPDVDPDHMEAFVNAVHRHSQSL
uniref:Uroporphyrinogen decarboxylase n=1 Tax=Hydra vulgaris TaxID=6087 RepID=T2MHC4_HYDVU